WVAASTKPAAKPTAKPTAKNPLAPSKKPTATPAAPADKPAAVPATPTKVEAAPLAKPLATGSATVSARATPSAEACASPATDADALLGELRRASVAKNASCPDDVDLIDRIAALEGALDDAEAENIRMRDAAPVAAAKAPTGPSPDEIAALMKTIAKMKAAHIAAMVDHLDDTTAASLLQRMKAEQAAAVLEGLKPERAAALTASMVNGRKS
ncbi:MAG TPA: hypothetical protein VGO62_02670, partial [Myxococcota bacterium]